MENIMKLIDLLVQELPKRGGWPENAIGATGLSGCSWGVPPWGCHPMAFNLSSHEIVTREQYESALAAPKKDEWDGESVPPVGAKCEIIINEGDLGPCEILFVGDSLIVWRQKSTFAEGSGLHRNMKFRPIRSEADKKRDESIEAIASYALPYKCGADIYDAIAAGKIPGVRIE